MEAETLCEKMRGDENRRRGGLSAGMGGCRGVLHVIDPWDTLYLLGKKYHVTVMSIMNANPYVDVYNLQVGDELCIPRSCEW